MDSKTLKRIKFIAALLLSLPILFHVYSPSMQLGGLGLLIGIIGYTISPIILFVTLIGVIVRNWR